MTIRKFGLTDVQDFLKIEFRILKGGKKK